MTTAEGLAAVSTVRFTLRSPVPVPSLNLGDIKLALHPGDTLVRTITLTNTGMGTMQTINLISPTILPWVSFSGLTVTTLAPGASTTFNVIIAPPADANLGLYVDRIGASDGSRTAYTGLSIEVTSATRGALAFVVHNDAGQLVGNAEITLIGRTPVHAISASGQESYFYNRYYVTANAHGVAAVEDMVLDTYDFTIAAPGHDRYAASVSVEPGSDAKIVTATLTAVPLSYKWTVTPITIEDRYEITLNLTFAVEIPKPQFGFLPPWVCVPQQVVTEMYENIIIVNPSLVELHDVKVELRGVTGMSLSAGGVIGTLLPQSSVVLALAISPGNYAYLNGHDTYLYATGTYVAFDSQTLQPLDEEQSIHGTIPLVNPRLTNDTVVVSMGDESVDLKLPELDDMNGDGLDKLPNGGGGGGDGGGTVTEVVKLQIQQQATLEREGFDAQLDLTSGMNQPLVRLSIAPRVTDANGVDVTDRFYIVSPEISGDLNAVDGSGNLTAYGHLTSHWVLIPGDGLGGTDLAGKTYYVKAVMSYFVGEGFHQVITNEVAIVIHPQPKLYFHYYIPANVLANEPFKLGLFVENVGDGIAHNLKIASGQPKIVENDSGLLIKFEIVGCSFGSQTGDVITLVMGDVQPHADVNGYWIMTSTLDGRFVEFTATLTHLAYKGIEINPLILGLTTEIIERDFLFADARDPNNCFTLIDRDRDGFPDYLINLTSGLHLPIIIPSDVTVTKSPTADDRTMDLTVAPTDGYVCVILPDGMPSSNLRSITRHNDDGTETVLSGNNFWKKDGKVYFVDELGYVDQDGYRHATSGRYTLDYRSALGVHEIVSAPVEFDILMSNVESLPDTGSALEYILHDPPAGSGSQLGTYELRTPIFYIPTPMTTGRKAAIRATVRNDGVDAESGTLDFYDQMDGGVETLIGSADITELRGLHQMTATINWTPTVAGKHTLTARVRGSDSPGAQMQETVVVNALPFADAGADFFADVSTPATFDGTRSLDEDGHVRLFMWDFGDNSVWSNGPRPTHVYTHSGTYRVHMVVKDDSGAMTEDVMQITVNEVRPDLFVESLGASPITPDEGQQVTISGRIRNVGASATLAAFYIGLYVDNEYAGLVKVTDALATGGYMDVTFHWTATLGNHVFKLVADDLGNNIEEADEANNVRTTVLNPNQVNFPDLVVQNIAYSISTSTPIAWGTPITINAQIKNVGNAQAGRFRVDFLVDGQFVGYGTVSALNNAEGDNVATVSLPWTPTPGAHTITVMADHPHAYIAELDKSNNTLDYAAPALTLVYADLAVTALQFWPADGRLELGQPLVAYVTITNKSAVDVPVSFPVGLFAGDIQVATIDVGSLSAGASTSVTLYWNANPGTYNVRATVDPGDVVPESVTSNNSLSQSGFAIQRLVPDISVQSITTTGAALVGQDVTINVRLANVGTGVTGAPFNVRLYINDVFVDTVRVTQNILGGRYYNWSRVWNVAGTSQFTVRVVADANAELADASLANNTREAAFAIQPSYLLTLASQPTYLTTDPLQITLAVHDSTNPTQVLGDTSGVAATVRLYDAGNNLLPSTPMVFNGDAFVLNTSALPAGDYHADVIVAGPRQTVHRALSFTVARDCRITTGASPVGDSGRLVLTTSDGILLSGDVLRLDGTPVAGALVTLDLTHAGATRRVTATTGTDGRYTYVFTPLPNDAGPFTLAATTVVDGLTRSTSANFVVQGLLLSVDHADLSLSARAGGLCTFTLQNIGTLSQDGLIVNVTRTAGAAGSAAASTAPVSLAAGASGTFTVSFSPGEFVGTAQYTVTVTSSVSGVAKTISRVITVVSHPPLPVLTITGTQDLDTGLLRGQTWDHTLVLRNDGYADLTNLAFNQPEIPWITLFTPAVSVLHPGDSTTLRVRIKIPNDADLTDYTDAITIISNTGATAVPIKIEVTQSCTLTLQVNLASRFNTLISGATVTLSLISSIYTNGAGDAVVAASQHLAGTSNAAGQVTFAGMLAGRYQVEIRAANCDPISGIWDLAPSAGVVVKPVQMNLNPFSLNVSQSASTDPFSLGQTQLGLVLSTNSDTRLITDRPGAEYVILRSGTLEHRLTYLSLVPYRDFPDNTSFSLNNVSTSDIHNINISATGAISGYISIQSLQIAKLPAHGSVVLSYSITVDVSALPAGDQIIDGAFHITAGSLLGEEPFTELTFPIRVRVVDDANMQNSRPYGYVPYSGPWPTGPILYGEDFIDHWFNQVNLTGTGSTGHDVGRVQLTQDVLLDGESVALNLDLTNIIANTIDIAGSRLVITDDTGTDVTNLFDVAEGVALPTSLAAGASASASWVIRPIRGNNLGGTDPAGKHYHVALQLNYRINGQIDTRTFDPQTFTVKPEAQLVIRYEVNQSFNGDDHAVGITVIVSNLGPGTATRVEIAPPSASAGTFSLAYTQSAEFTNVQPGTSQTAQNVWILNFANVADIAAITSSLASGGTQVGTDSGLSFDAPVVQQFIGSHSMSDLSTALQQLLIAAKDKIHNEIDTLAKFYVDFAIILREAKALVNMDLGVQLYNIFGQMLKTCVSVVQGAQSLAKGITSWVVAGGVPGAGTLQQIASVQAMVKNIQKFTKSMNSFGGQFNGVLNAALSNRSSQAAIELLYKDLGELLKSTTTTADEYRAFLETEVTYTRIRSDLAWNDMGQLPDNPTTDQVTAMLDAVIAKGGANIQGLASLESELDQMVTYTQQQLNATKSSALFPIDTLYTELTALTTTMQRLGTGKGGTENMIATLQTWWFAAGEATIDGSGWRPVYQQSWDFGNIFINWRTLSRLDAMQWDNYAMHWNAIGSTMLISFMANSANAIGGLAGPMGGSFMQYFQKVTADAVAAWMDALTAMRQAEYTTNVALFRAAAKYLMQHQEETNGIWRMFFDIQNHIDYINSHSAIDPAVTLAIQSLDFKDAVARDNDEIALSIGEMNITNTSSISLDITPTINVYAGGELIASFTGTVLSLAAGATGTSKALLTLPRSVFFGNGGYDLDITFDAFDPVSLSRGASGPYYAHMYAGTAAELAQFHSQIVMQPLGGVVNQETSFERYIDIASNIAAIRILLTQAADANIDLHLYDAQGRHVGLNGTIDEIGIPHATYSGSSGSRQVIALSSLTPGRYRLVVTVNSALPDDLFNVALLEIPTRPALLVASASSISMTVGSGLLSFTLDAMEWGGIAGVSNLQASLGTFRNSSGVELPVTLPLVTFNTPGLNPGQSTNISVSLNVGDAAADGDYTGLLTLTGADAISGNPVEYVVQVVIHLDRTAPTVPQITVTPNPVTAGGTVTINGTSDPNTRIEVYVDDILIGDITTDDTGAFAYDALNFIQGHHAVKCRAVDSANNASAFSNVVDLAYNVDVIAPTTSLTIGGIPGGSGLYLSPVLITLLATDQSGASGVAGVQYSVNGGPWLDYAQPFTLATNGHIRLSYRAADHAGNAELVHLANFDLNADATPPSSSVQPLPAIVGGARFAVAWSGQDNVGGSGIASFDIYVSVDGQPFALWLGAITALSGQYQGAVGHTYAFYSVATDVAGNVQAVPAAAQAQTTVSSPQVLDRRPFYNNSAFDGHDALANALDDAAIATDKTVLLPGQIATFANYTSYSRGLNGIVIDIASLANAQSLNASDFTFLVGTSSDAGTWTSAPAPASVTVRSGAGINGSDRVEIIWADNAIQNVWLQVTVGANAHTGLSSPDVFYFGNAIAESGNSSIGAAVTVADILAARGRISANAVSITSPWDYDRDGFITTADVQVAKQNTTAGAAILVLLQAPSTPLASPGSAHVPVVSLVQPSDSDMASGSGTAADTSSAPSFTAAVASSALKPVLGLSTALAPAVSTGPSLVPAPLSGNMTAGQKDILLVCAQGLSGNLFTSDRSKGGSLVADYHSPTPMYMATHLAKAALVGNGDSVLASGTANFVGLTLTSRGRYTLVDRYRGTKLKATRAIKATLAQSTVV